MAERVIDRAKSALGVKSDTDFGRAIGVTPSTVGGYHRRNGALSLEQLIKISEMTGRSVDWLLFGKDNIGAPDCETVVIPLYDAQVSAGSGTYVDHEDIVQQIPFDKQWLNKEGLYPKDLACLPIHGDSMSPNLLDGDIVLVNHAVKSGDGVFVLRMAEMLRIKRLQWFADGRLRISSDNPIYNEEIINPRDMPDFAILGACHTKIGRVM